MLLVDGAQYAEVLTGVPMLRDPLNKLGYAFHPYYVNAINGNADAYVQRSRIPPRQGSHRRERVESARVHLRDGRTEVSDVHVGNQDGRLRLVL